MEIQKKLPDTTRLRDTSISEEIEWSRKIQWQILGVESITTLSLGDCGIRIPAPCNFCMNSRI